MMYTTHIHTSLKENVTDTPKYRQSRISYQRLSKPLKLLTLLSIISSVMSDAELPQEQGSVAERNDYANETLNRLLTIRLVLEIIAKLKLLNENTILYRERYQSVFRLTNLSISSHHSQLKINKFYWIH